MNENSQPFEEDLSFRQSAALKLWIELIRCSNKFGGIIDKKLRQEYRQSISRFDVLSQLERELDNGLTVGDLGQRLIASKGNITGLVNRMIKDGLVTKISKPHDRRYYQVNIFQQGLDLFRKMADSHARWVSDFFQSLDNENINEITNLLGDVRSSLGEYNGNINETC